MKRKIYEAMTCDPDHVITQNDLNALEKHLDVVWNKLGIDIAFTRHFLDRVNDERNQKQITLCELARIFLETFRQFGKKLSSITAREWEAVLTDKKTNVNVPFVLKHNGREVEIVAKTVMRKSNFTSPDPKLMVAHFTGEKMNKKLREDTGDGLPQNEPVSSIYAVDDVDISATQICDPEVLTMLNGFLASLTKKKFINPYYPVQQAFTKLSAVGLSFPLRGLDLGGDTGVVLIPVSHFGGRIGQNLDGSWADHDGISDKIPGGIFLKITYSQSNGSFVVNMQLISAEDRTLEPTDELELDTTDIETEGVQAGTSDATTDEYPFDSVFQPTQDGETIFDSFIKRGRKIIEASRIAKEDYSDIKMDESAPAQVGIYKGKKYRLMFLGPTKYGQRARLQFFDGSKDFWVDASLVQVDHSGAASHSSSSSSSGKKCDECGAPGAKYSARDSSGIPGTVCARCSRMPSYELSFM